MKSFTPKSIVLVAIFLLGLGLGGRACNLSNMSLVSVTGTGPFVITVDLCVGMGLTGATKGADQRTASVFFGFWGQAGLLVTAFTPATMVSQAPPQLGLRCTLTGSIQAGIPIYGTRTTVAYPMPAVAPCTGVTATNYGCINNQVICGPAISVCSTHTFTTNLYPDSMRAFGVEGAGNPVGGCYPNADMLIIFPPLAIEWGDIEAIQHIDGIEVHWTTLTETNADYFVVERAIGAGDFEAIGEVFATGNSNSPIQYTFDDRSPGLQNRYRIVQFDRAGEANESRIVEASYFIPEGLSWGSFGPNPTADHLALSFYTPMTNIKLTLVDPAGRVVAAPDMAVEVGGNALQLDLSTLRPGNYFVRIQSPDHALVRMVTKL